MEIENKKYLSLFLVQYFRKKIIKLVKKLKNYKQKFKCLVFKIILTIETFILKYNLLIQII